MSGELLDQHLIENFAFGEHYFFLNMKIMLFCRFDFLSRFTHLWFEECPCIFSALSSLLSKDHRDRIILHDIILKNAFFSFFFGRIRYITAKKRICIRRFIMNNSNSSDDDSDSMEQHLPM